MVTPPWTYHGSSNKHTADASVSCVDTEGVRSRVAKGSLNAGMDPSQEKNWIQLLLEGFIRPSVKSADD